MHEIRTLGDGDEAVFKALRLRALQEHPEAFASSYDDEKDITLEAFRERLISGLPESVMIGLFVDHDLCGMLSVRRRPNEKLHHLASFGSMYVVPKQRGKRFGQAILSYGLEHARQLEGVLMVTLAVTAGNTAARNLYRGAGFVTWGVQPDFIGVGNVFHDIEWMVLRL